MAQKLARELAAAPGFDQPDRQIGFLPLNNRCGRSARRPCPAVRWLVDRLQTPGARVVDHPSATSCLRLADHHGLRRSGRPRQARALRGSRPSPPAPCGADETPRRSGRRAWRCRSRSEWRRDRPGGQVDCLHPVVVKASISTSWGVRPAARQSAAAPSAMSACSCAGLAPDGRMDQRQPHYAASGCGARTFDATCGQSQL